MFVVVPNVRRHGLSERIPEIYFAGVPSVLSRGPASLRSALVLDDNIDSRVLLVGRCMAFPTNLPTIRVPTVYWVQNACPGA